MLYLDSLDINVHEFKTLIKEYLNKNKSPYNITSVNYPTKIIKENNKILPYAKLEDDNLLITFSNLCENSFIYYGKPFEPQCIYIEEKSDLTLKEIFQMFQEHELIRKPLIDIKKISPLLKGNINLFQKSFSENGIKIVNNSKLSEFL